MRRFRLKYRTSPPQFSPPERASRKHLVAMGGLHFVSVMQRQLLQRVRVTLP
jgi:hypothetical protein